MNVYTPERTRNVWLSTGGTRSTPLNVFIPVEGVDTLPAAGDNFTVVDGVLLLINWDTLSAYPIWVDAAGGGALALGSPGQFPGPNYRLVDESLQIRNPASGAWHSPFVVGESLAIGGPGVLIPNYRVSGGMLQLLNVSDGNYHPLGLVGAAGQEALAIGEGEE